MGSWGFETFEDDATLDWVVDFLEDPGFHTVEKALDSAISTEGYLDDLAAAGALAAAEVVAAVNGRPSKLLPEEVTRWVALQEECEDTLLAKATRAVSRVFENSELREIWQDMQAVDKWKEAVDGLLDRLIETQNGS